MSDDPSESAKPDRSALSRGQAIGLLLAALIGLIVVAWVFDWETSSGFWRGFMRVVFEIVTHLGR